MVLDDDARLLAQVSSSSMRFTWVCRRSTRPRRGALESGRPPPEVPNLARYVGGHKISIEFSVDSGNISP
jgi:hypothetical protein